MDKWTEDQLKIAFNLYCKMPFGKMHHRNPEIMKIAKLIGRTPSAVAMKLVNFASLDPSITSTGRKGLANASVADKAIWDEFHNDWERLALESQDLLSNLEGEQETLSFPEEIKELEEIDEDYVGEMKTVLAKVRIKQSFFRKAVLSSYQNRCCMTGLNDERLLIASHIVPWSKDEKSRLNPRNGLCLSALHDRAFDKGLITVDSQMQIKVSEQVRSLSENEFAQKSLLALEGKSISLPEKFLPSEDFLTYHNNVIFLG